MRPDRIDVGARIVELSATVSIQTDGDLSQPDGASTPVRLGDSFTWHHLRLFFEDYSADQISVDTVALSRRRDRTIVEVNRG
jgi:hypothetical protein